MSEQFQFVKLFLAMSFLSMLMSCSIQKGVPTLKDKDIVMSLEKGSCRGKCAVYTLNIYKNRYATYTGRANTDKMGKHIKLLADTTYKNLEALFLQANFDQLQTTYPSDIADFPSISIGYHRKKNVKIVTFKENKPGELAVIQAKMEQIANSFDWISVDKKVENLEYNPVNGRNRQTDENMIQNEIIIQPKEEVNIDHWVKRYEGYQVKIKQKLAPNFNYYVITWDLKMIGADEMLQKIKSDSDIILASMNKMVTTREN